MLPEPLDLENKTLYLKATPELIEHYLLPRLWREVERRKILREQQEKDARDKAEAEQKEIIEKTIRRTLRYSFMLDCERSEATKRLTQAVYDFHPPVEWLVVRECQFENRRIDVLAKSFTGCILAYEVKTDRADFLSDINTPEKRRPVVDATTQFYYVTPLGMVGKEEIPEECGLICYNFETKEFIVNIPAPVKLGQIANTLWL